MLRNVLSTLSATMHIPFVRGVAIFQAGSTVGMGISFLSSIVYARLLGLEQYGLFAVVSSFVSLISIITAYGQETATTTFLAEAVGHKNIQSIRLILRYYLQATLFSTLAYACLFLLAPILASLLTHDAASVTIFARILLINAALQPIYVLTFMVLQLARKYTTVILIENLTDALQLLLGIVLILMGFGLLGIVVATVTITVLSIPILWVLYERTAASMHFSSLRMVAREVLQGGTGSYARQGFWVAIDKNISSNLYPNILIMMLNQTASLEVVGLFRLAFRLVTLPLSIIMPSIARMTNVSIPKLAAQNRKVLRQSCIKVFSISIIISTLAGCAAALILPPLIPVVYGEAFRGAIPAFLIMLPINVIASTHSVSVPLLRLFRRVWSISIVNCTGIIIATALYILLAPVLSPLIAISVSILSFHLFSLVLFVYLWLFFRHKPPFPSSAQ